MIGASPVRIIIKHLLPNTVSILILNLCSSIPSYIFTEASLSFLGMGLSSDVISLGVLISQGKARWISTPGSCSSRRQCSALRCWRSTCWAMVCATRWTPAPLNKEAAT